MHQSLASIKEQLEQIITQLNSAIPNEEPFGNAHGNWTFPGLTRGELVHEAQSIIEVIEHDGLDEVGENEGRLTDYIRRLEFLRKHTIPQMWGNSASGVPAYMFTLNGLRNTLVPALNRDARKEAIDKLRRLTAQLRSMEARLNGLEPRSASVGKMVDAIERAYNAADQLPTDLESLAEAQKKIEVILQQATKDQGRLLTIREQADGIEKALSKRDEDAKNVLKRCETAYSAATSVGLAAAFHERSKALATSMWVYVVGLIVALAAASFFGGGRLQTLVELFKDPTLQPSVIVPNLLLAVLSVGAPVWFAWLATKQIGQRFRLSEDYAFKASVARAYEGFRREAARFDKDMEARLLASALTRLDELPLRLIETENHGSPWQELAHSDVVKQALKSVPNFTMQVRELAEKAVTSVTPSKMGRSAAPKLAETNPPAE